MFAIGSITSLQTVNGAIHCLDNSRPGMTNLLGNLVICATHSYFYVIYICIFNDVFIIVFSKSMNTPLITK